MFNNYNPYQQYQPMSYQSQTQIPQPLQQLQSKNISLQGKQVESTEIVKSIEIPLDGSISYFPLVDNSTIVTKQLQNDGTTKIVVFKPVDNRNDEDKYITSKELKKAIDELNLAELDDIKDDIKEIKKQLKKRSE